MVGDTIYRPQGLVAYPGGTVSGQICLLAHVFLDGTERTRTKKGGGVACMCMVSGRGGVCNSPDVIGVSSRKSRLQGGYLSCLAGLTRCKTDFAHRFGGEGWINGNSVRLDPEKRILGCPSAWLMKMMLIIEFSTLKSGGVGT